MFSKFQMEQHVQSSIQTKLRPTEVDDGTLWQRFKNGVQSRWGKGEIGMRGAAIGGGRGAKLQVSRR